MWQDLIIGARNLRRTLGTSILAIASLALGIMATTAMYSVVHAVILNPFPYKDVDRLVSIQVSEPGQPYGRTGYSVDQYLEFRERTTIFEGLIASTISDVVWTGNGEPQRLRGNHGPYDTFDVMGVPPLLGRTPVKADVAPGAPQVAVLGYRFWQRQFGGDPSVLGRKLVLNGVTRTVIGVMPPRFMWRGADVYLPVDFRRGQVIEDVRFVHVLGRVKPHVTPAQAEAELRPIIEDLKKQNPSDFPEQWRVRLLKFSETFPSSIRNELWILFGAVGLLLLIACANVSNLLLSKAAGRQREMAVRASLGAGKGRLIRQLLTESLLLALAGGTFGVALAFGALRVLIALVPPGTIPDEAEIALNLPVLLFALAVSVLTTILFGLAPAIQSASINLTEALKAGGRNSSGTRRQAGTRRVLVVAEVGLSVVLLAGAALMMRVLLELQRVDIGFEADRVLSMRVPLSESRYPDAARRVQFFQDLIPRIAALPGVRQAGLNTGLHPFMSYGVMISVDGLPPDRQRVGFHAASRGYFDVIAARLVRGRLFTEAEEANRQQVAVVNEKFVERYFAGREPVGAVARVPLLKGARWNLADDGFRITGVIRDIPNRGLENDASPEMFVPYTVLGEPGFLAIKTDVEPMSLAKAAAAQVYAIDGEQPVTDVKPVSDYLRDWAFAGPRFNLILFGLFAGLGLTLAVVGVYGVIASSVAQRTAEIGIRMALGATVGAVVRMVLFSGMRLVLAGVVLGFAGSLVAARLL
ncbi:MAG: ABC transporter permease, partial [Bryobacteraceae bacterium]|nr:ABC transporter permease [Bryobacteraceae bacterium]